MPEVSIIIPNYNGRRFLETCLGSLQRQTYQDFEVILVDDASGDDSVAWTRTHFPDVHIITMEHNSGLDIGCNRGAAAAQGQILVMLNNDTEAEPGWLEALVTAMHSAPRIAAVASKMLLYDRRDTLHTAGDMMGQDGIPRNRGVWEQDTGQYDTKPRVFGGCGGGVAYRRTAWEEMAGFDQDLFMYLEDVDLAWRLRLAGWEAVLAPQARLYHHLGATGGGVFSSFYTGRNTIWVIAKDYPRALWCKYWRKIIQAQFRITMDALRAWRGREARARLRGQFAGVWGLPRWLAKRRAVQRSIRVPMAEIESLLLE